MQLNATNILSYLGIGIGAAVLVKGVAMLFGQVETAVKVVSS